MHAAVKEKVHVKLGKEWKIDNTTEMLNLHQISSNSEEANAQYTMSTQKPLAMTSVRYLNNIHIQT